MSDRGTRSAEALGRLTSVSRALTYAVSIEEVLDITVDCAADLLAVERVVLMLREDDEPLRIRACLGIPEAAVERFREPLDETLVARLAGLLGEDSAVGFLGVPLIVRGRVTGLLAVLGADARPPTARQEWLLSALADQAAVALDNARSETTRTTLEDRVAELRSESVHREQAMRIVGHDLRSPLSALQGYIDLLQTEAFGPATEAQRQAFDRIAAISAHLQAVTANVLEIGRLTSGTVVAERERVRVAEVVEGAVVVVTLAAEEAGVELVTEVPADLALIGDTDRLRQVLVQLLDNAIKYSPEGSRVTVTARTEPATTTEGEGEGSGEEAEEEAEERVAIRISDEGPGIPAEHVDEVFEPYHQLPDRLRAGGLGLGLAIARGLVDHMGGTLDVEDPEQPGATLVLRLPAAPPPSSDS